MELRRDLRFAPSPARHGKIPDRAGARTPEGPARAAVVEGDTLKKTGEHPSRSLGFLSRYHDGELTREEIADFDRHAGRCAECRFAAAEYEAVLAMYRAAGSEPADDLLASRISRRIDTEVRHRAPVRYITLQIDLVWASVLAVGLVGAIALYAVLARRGGSPLTVARNAAPSAPAPEPAAPAEPESNGPAPPPRRPSLRKAAPPPAADDRPPAPSADSTFAAEADRVAASGAAAPSPALSPVPPEAALPASGKSEAGAASEPLPVGGPVSDPVLIRRVEPIVSAEARRGMAGGAPVVIVAIISENGEVTRPKIVRSNPALDGAALRAVRLWRYRPALRDGRPVAAYLTITVNVDLR